MLEYLHTKRLQLVRVKFLENGFYLLCNILTIVGVDCGEGPPVPIPNTEVKLACAENTRREAARKDKQMPTFKPVNKQLFTGFFVFIALTGCGRDVRNKHLPYNYNGKIKKVDTR